MDLLFDDDPNSPSWRPSLPSASKRIHVVYYLNRAGKLDQPHLLEGCIHSDGFHLKDFKHWLAALRGKGIPNSFSWSYKRNYKNTFIWHDLDDDDIIQPVGKDEYVLMGSEMKDSALLLLPEMAEGAAGKCRSCGTATELRKLQHQPEEAKGGGAMAAAAAGHGHAINVKAPSRNSCRKSGPTLYPAAAAADIVQDVRDIISRNAAVEDADEEDEMDGGGGSTAAVLRRGYRSMSAKSCELPVSPPPSVPGNAAAVDADHVKRSVPRKSRARSINRSLQYINISPCKKPADNLLSPAAANSSQSAKKTYAPLMYSVKANSVDAAKQAAKLASSACRFSSAFDHETIVEGGAAAAVDAATQTSKESVQRSNTYSGGGAAAAARRYGGEDDGDDDELIGTPVKIMLEVGTSPAHSVQECGRNGGAKSSLRRVKTAGGGGARCRNDKIADAADKSVIKTTTTTLSHLENHQSPTAAVGGGRIHVVDRYLHHLTASNCSATNAGAGGVVAADHYNCCPKIPAAHYLASNSFRFSMKKSQHGQPNFGAANKSGGGGGNGRTMKKGLIAAPHQFWKQLLSCCHLQDVIGKSETVMMSGGGNGLRYNNYMACSGAAVGAGAALPHISTPSSWISSSNPSSVNDQDRL